MDQFQPQARIFQWHFHRACRWNRFAAPERKWRMGGVVARWRADWLSDRRSGREPANPGVQSEDGRDENAAEVALRGHEFSIRRLAGREVARHHELPAHFRRDLVAGTRAQEVTSSALPDQREALRRRRALAMPETELKLSAALASLALSSEPEIGYNAPASTQV